MSQMKILIVDDSRVMRQIVKRTLRQAGFTGHDLVEAGDGSAALALILEEQPDLVLADWNMPGLTGLELLQQVRANGVTVPFGFVTSEVSERMRERALEAGAAFVIAKPFTDVAFQDALIPLGV
jgi:two-component system chemotaxis response regulator CheY